VSASPSEGLLALSSLTAHALKRHWRTRLGSEAPGYGRHLLAARLAYRLQVLAQGGLNPATQAAIGELLARAAAGEPWREHSPRAGRGGALTEGTTLTREWRGERHEVQVVADGYLYQDRTYASLTAAARAITGMHRSGPAFFSTPAADHDDGPAPTKGESDLALAVACACHWCALIEDECYRPVALAFELGLRAQGLARRLRLSVLAPDLTQAVVTGPRVPGLSRQDLVRLPLDWPSQRREASRIGLRSAPTAAPKAPFPAVPYSSRLAASTCAADATRDAYSRALATEPRELTVREQLIGLIDRHAVACDLRAGTVQCYRAHIPVVTRFCEQQGIRRLQDWSRDQGLAFVAWMSVQRCAHRWRGEDEGAPRPWSPRRINLVLNLARLAFRGLQESGEISEDPLRGVRNRREERSMAPVYLSDEEAQALLDACDLRQGAGCRDFLIIAFCLCIGLRPSEVCRVRRCDLQGSRLTVQAAATKIRDTHTLLLPEDPQQPGELDPELRQPLTEYLAWRASRSTAVTNHDPLFVNVEGLPLTPDLLYHNCKNLAARIGIRPRRVSIYAFRHTCAVRALRQSNWDIEFVRRLLRHRSMDMTQRYLKLFDKDFEERARRVDMLGGISLPAARSRVTG
jgi:integrase